ncbi:MAG TPA: glycosyltransferase family 1 protein [Nitrospirae bacterium]|nr:glycosyltransferase family 1 protein [Nitrospirota bacterium]
MKRASKLKITIDVRMIDSSGIGTYLQNLIPKIISHYKGIDFSLLGYKKMADRFSWTRCDNAVLINCNSNIYSIAEQLELFQKIPKDTTLLWSPHFNIPLLYTGKLVVTIHDMFHIAMPEFIKGLHKKLYSKGMFTAVCHKADAILCVSKFTKAELTRLMNVDNLIIHTIYNGVNRKWSSTEKKTRPYIKPYIFFVGNVKPHKNIVRLIDAFQRILNKTPHDLVIVGKRDEFITGDKEAFIRASKLGERIYFAGYIDDDTLKSYYSYADALVFPSLYEGFGMPPIEAMACGCPVIASNAASLPEICGDAAYYVDPYDVESIAEGMHKVLTDDNLRQNLIKKGRERARLFSWEKSADEYIKVFDEVLGAYG